MVDRNTGFKVGISLGTGAEVSFLLGIIIVAIEEYDPSHMELFGIIMAILSASIALSVFLVILYNVLRMRASPSLAKLASFFTS
jgi:hypothetical protein